MPCLGFFEAIGTHRRFCIADPPPGRALLCKVPEHALHWAIHRGNDEISSGISGLRGRCGCRGKAEDQQRSEDHGCDTADADARPYLRIGCQFHAPCNTRVSPQDPQKQAGKSREAKLETVTHKFISWDSVMGSEYHIDSFPKQTTSSFNNIRLKHVWIAHHPTAATSLLFTCK